jgi:hypothetical protein
MNKVMQRLERTSWTSMGFLTSSLIIWFQLDAWSTQRPWQRIPAQLWNTDLQKHYHSRTPIPPPQLQVQKRYQQDRGTVLGMTVRVA